MVIRIVLICISLGLSGLVVAQWVRDSAQIAEQIRLHGELTNSEATVADLNDKLKVWESELTRLTEVSKNAAAKEQEQAAEIARLTGILKERDAAQATVNAAAAPPADYADNLKNLGEEVSKRNDLITKANASIQKAIRERDDFADRLNARTRELNELTAKYNKLVK
jgi:methyl-accepting chemotaxis protein